MSRNWRRSLVHVVVFRTRHRRKSGRRRKRSRILRRKRRKRRVEGVEGEILRKVGRTSVEEFGLFGGQFGRGRGVT
jgi:transposase